MAKKTPGDWKDLYEGRQHHTTKTGFSAQSLGADYTPDEVEFMLAMDRYKRENGRPFPTCCEVLAVIAALGYRKVTRDPGTAREG